MVHDSGLPQYEQGLWAFFPSLIFCTANETTIQVMLAFVFLVFLGND